MCTVRGFFSPRLGNLGDCDCDVAARGGIRGKEADLNVDEGVVGVGE